MYNYTSFINKNNMIGYIYIVKYLDTFITTPLIIGITYNTVQTKIQYIRNGRIDIRFFHTTGNILNQLNVILIICAPYISIGHNYNKINLNHMILFNIINSVINLNRMNRLQYFQKKISMKKLKKQRENINPLIWNHLCITLDKEFPNLMYHPMDIDDIENHYDETYIDSFIKDFI